MELLTKAIYAVAKLLPCIMDLFNHTMNSPSGRRKQIVRAMKLTAVILVACCLHVSANGTAQKVSLSFKNAAIESVFKAIKKQTGFTFIAKSELLDKSRKVSMNVKDAPLSEALEACFKNQPFTYSMDGRIITVEPVHVPPNLWDALPPPVDISGVVYDSSGNPIEGASVKLSPGNKGTSTGSGGLFTISKVTAGRYTLEISFVGYEPVKRMITVTDTEPLVLGSIFLRPSETAMDQVEVINTGYQTIARERSTGSFGVVSKEQLERPTTNIATRLIGTTAGLQAKLDVNGNPTFRLRGQTTLIPEDAFQPLAQQPLVVLDGFPIQGDFNTINPNDVESVTILKDAAAASIWGARAANGVIVVVSKAGRKGTPLKVEFSAFTQIGKKFDLDYVNPLASSAETVEYEKAAYKKWSSATVSGSLNSDYNTVFSLGTTAMSEYDLGFITLAERDAILAKLKTQSNKKQISDHLLANPSTQQYNLSLSGSTAKMSNHFALLFEDNQSNFKGSGNKKYMLNVRSNSSVFKWLDLTVGGMVQYNKNDSNGVTLRNIQSMSPYEMLLNEDGSYTNIHQYYYPVVQRLVPTHLFPYKDWTYNPIKEINNRSITSEQINARLQAGLTFKIMRGLNFDSRVQWELFNTFNRSLNNENTYAVRSAVNTSTTWNRATNVLTRNLPMGSILNQNRAKLQAYNFRNQLSFNRVLGTDHEINLIAGTETNNRVAETFIHPTTYGYNDQSLTTGVFPNGPGGSFRPLQNWLGSRITFPYTNTFTYRTERFFSYYGNLAYTYKNKYTLSGSFRTDAANIISDDPQYRYDPFWSIGGAWQIYKENFFNNVSLFDRLNIRFTYGYNGNVDRSTAFQPLINLSPAPDPYTGEQTAGISSFGNPTLRWEKTGTWNLGIDYSILGNKLFGKIDVYNKSGKDLIATLSIPAVNGTTTQKLNNASMTNKGIEIEVGTYVPIQGKNILWQGNLSFSYNKNRITKLFVATYPAYALTAGTSASYVVGYDANTVWRYEYAGMRGDQPTIKGPKGELYDFSAYVVGDGREFMLNMGTSVAPYTLGFMNSFKIYDFNVSFIVTGKFGHVFQRKGFNYPPTWSTRLLPNKKIGEVLEGDPSKIVPLPQNPIEPNYYFWDRFHQNMNYLIESASHIRMQEVNITYNLNSRLLSSVRFTRCQVFAQGNDLFTVYANKANEDPEYPLGTMKPMPKLTLGIKCEF